MKLSFITRYLLTSVALSIVVSIPLILDRFTENTFYYFEVVLQSSVEGNAQLFFDKGRGVRQTDSVAVKVIGGNAQQLMRLPLPSGKYRLGGLRFDPIDREAQVVLSQPRIVDSSNTVVKYFAASDFLPVQQINKTRAAGELIILMTTPGANDPILLIRLDTPLQLRMIQSNSVSKTAREMLMPFTVIMFICSMIALICRNRFEGSMEGSEWSPMPIFSMVSWLFLMGTFLGLCLFTSPLADDFCIASVSRSRGFWGPLKASYFDWTGRYFGVGLSYLYFLIPNFFAFYKMTTLLLLVLFFASICIFTWSLLRPLLPYQPILCTSAVIFSTYVATMPSPLEGFYWLLGGGFFYQLGASLTFFLFSLIFLSGRATREDSRHRGLATAGVRRILLGALCCSLVAAIVGTTETNMVILLTILFFYTALMTLKRGSGNSPELWVMILGAILCSAVVIMAPGNSVRSAIISDMNLPTKQLWFTLQSAAFSALSFFSPVKFHFVCLSLGSLTLLPVLLRAADKLYVSGRVAIGRFFTFFLFFFFLMAISFTPAFYAMGSLPPLRTLNLIHLVFVIGWFIQSFLLVAMVRRRFPHFLTLLEKTSNVALAFLILSIASFGNLRHCLPDLLFRANEYHRVQSERHRFALHGADSGTDTVVLPPVTVRPTSLISADLEPCEGDSKHWINACMAQFYQIRTLVVQAPMVSEIQKQYYPSQ